MSNSILEISDGTTTIDLLNTTRDGFLLSEWTPAIAEPKGGGIWQSSPLSDGKRMAIQHWENVVETFEIKLAAANQDKAIWWTQELRRLLQKSRQYWTTKWQSEPVWIKAQGPDETNARYAVIKDWRLQTDDNPYAQPFYSCPGVVMDELTLGIERDHWQDTQPGTGTCLYISGQQDYYHGNEITFVPGQSSDDAIDDGAAITLNGTSLTVGNVLATSIDSGIRFLNVTVPKSETIISAYVRFVAGTTKSDDDVNLDIYGEDADDAATFSTHANFIGRTLTTAKVDWDTIAAQTAGDYVYSPEIKTIIQEIVNRAGWVSGNDLVLFFNDDGSTASAARNLAAWDNATYPEPMLYILTDAQEYSFGMERTCSQDVFIANKHNKAQITHIFYYDASAGTYSGNLMGAAKPTALLPATPANGDMLYFICDTSLPDSGPFYSIVFDIATAQTGITHTDFEFWDGAVWVGTDGTGIIADNTEVGGVSLSKTGVVSIYIRYIPALPTWVITTVNGIQGYIFRINVIAAGVGATPPTQQNRDIYTVVTPYLDILAADVKGDIPAKIKIDIDTCTYITGSWDTRGVIVGLRSLSRGADFTPFINIAQDANSQNNPNITIRDLGAVGAWATDIIHSSVGEVFLCSGVAIGNAIAIDFNTTFTQQYKGTFHAYLRVFQDGGAAGDYGAKLSVFPTGWVGEMVYTNLSSSYNLLDLGVFSYPQINTSYNWSNLSLVISVDNVPTAATFSLIDLILMPVDEWFSVYDLKTYGRGNVLIDSTSYPNHDRFSTTEKNLYATTNATTIMPSSSSSPAIVQANTNQRLWFLSFDDNAGHIYPNYTKGFRVETDKVQRYLSMRGSR